MAAQATTIAMSVPNCHHKKVHAASTSPASTVNQKRQALLPTSKHHPCNTPIAGTVTLNIRYVHGVSTQDTVTLNHNTFARPQHCHNKPHHNATNSVTQLAITTNATARPRNPQGQIHYTKHHDGCIIGINATSLNNQHDTNTITP